MYYVDCNFKAKTTTKMYTDTATARHMPVMLNSAETKILNEFKFLQ